MIIREAQREVRQVFMHGFPGQFVSGSLWLMSAAFGTWGRPRQAILFLVVGGMFIFPLTQLLLRALGRRTSLSRENALNGLAMQVAFTVPLTLPLVAAATLHRQLWFYPAFMLVVGAHYLPFVFLYGMPQFGVLGGLLIAGGLLLGLYGPPLFSLGGWLTGAALWIFAYVGLARSRLDPNGFGTSGGR